MTSRGMISARQRTNSYRPNGAIASHVLTSTIEDARITQPVIRCRAFNNFTLGTVSVRQNQTFYLVSSKFAGRYYVVVPSKTGWKCSSTDERVSARCIDQATEYRQSLIVKMAAKKAAMEVATETPCKEVKADDTDAWFLSMAKAEDARREQLKNNKADAVAEAQAFIAEVQAKKAGKEQLEVLEQSVSRKQYIAVENRARGFRVHYLWSSFAGCQSSNVLTSSSKVSTFVGDLLAQYPQMEEVSYVEFQEVTQVIMAAHATYREALFQSVRSAISA